MTLHYIVRAFGNDLDTVYSPKRSDSTTGADITLDADLASADQIDLTWSSFAGTTTYKVELAQDIVEFHESIDIQGTETETSLLGFESAESGQNHLIRIVALDASGSPIASSNVRVIASPAADPPESPAPSSPLDPPPNIKVLVPFNGFFEPGGNTLDPPGNAWFEMMVRDTGLSLKTSPNLQTYNHNHGGEAMADLLFRMDADGDRVITAAEDEAAKVIVAGFSWGGVEAANFTRKLRADRIFAGGHWYTLEVDVSVELLVVIDPVRRAYWSVSKIFKPLWGKIETNVDHFLNYYQTRGLGTGFDLYLPGSSQNGQNFPPFTVGSEVISVPFQGLKGDPLSHRLAAANAVQTDVTTLGFRYATNVEYFREPLTLYPNQRFQGNWFDGDLEAVFVQHDTIPYYVRGGIGTQFSDDINWMKDIDNV